MKLDLYSNLFKNFFQDKTIEFDDASITKIYVCDDRNLPKIKNRKDENAVFMDFSNIALNSKELKTLTFNFINSNLIRGILKTRVPSEELNIYFSKLDYNIFNDIDLSKLKSLRLFEVENVKNSTNRFTSISQMKELTSLEITRCNGLDLNSLFKDIANPDKIKKLRFCGNLPTAKELSKFTNLEELDISGIEDPILLRTFLSNIYLGNIKKLNIINCNMYDMDQDIIVRFESLTNIKLTNNINANYNEILQDLPNPTNVKEISFTGGKNANIYKIQDSLLERYENLESLEFGALNVNLENLHEYLMKANKLETFSLCDVNFNNLDFIKDINPNIAISLKHAGLINFSLLTPEIAKSHSEIYYADPRNKAITYLEKDGGFSLITEVENDILYFVEDLIKECDFIRGATVDISKDSNGVNQTLAFLTPYADKCEDGYITIFEDYTKITPKDIDKLNNNDKLKNVVIADKNNDDRNIINRFTYDVNETKLLEQKVREITDDIPRDLPDIDKFMIIYRRLGSRIVYDMGIVGENAYSQYAKDNRDGSRNCKNGLLRDTCVCAGYADILYNCLRKVGINAYKISGIAGEYHQWNIVELDGELYNVDLTWDAPTIAKGDVRDLPYCLIGDNEFKRIHTSTNGFDGKCPNTYSRRQVKQALKRAMEFDNIPYKKNIFEKLKDRITGSSRKNMALPSPSSLKKYPKIEGQDGNMGRPTGVTYEKVSSWVLNKEDEIVVKRQLQDVHKNSVNSKNLQSNRTIDTGIRDDDNSK